MRDRRVLGSALLSGLLLSCGGTVYEGATLPDQELDPNQNQWAGDPGPGDSDNPPVPGDTTGPGDAPVTGDAAPDNPPVPENNQARPPDQPTSGIGGSDYPYARFDEIERSVDATQGNGDDYTLFLPRSDTLTSAPVVVFLHGWACPVESFYSGWVEHIVGTGHIVIYPAYQDTMFEDVATVEFTDRAIESVKDGIAFLQSDPSAIQPEPEHFALVGHSAGGAIALNMANRWQEVGLPAPRAIFTFEASVGTEKVYVDPSLAGIPPGILLDCMMSTHSTQSGWDGCKHLWPSITHIPPSNREILYMDSDTHGEPDLIAEHTTALGSDLLFPIDTLDYFGLFKITEGVLACAFYQTDCAYGRGNTPERRFMGLWSDGVPVQELIISSDPVAFGP